MILVGNVQTEGATLSRIKVLWFFLCCGDAFLGSATEPKWFCLCKSDLADFRFMSSQMRSYGSDEFVLVCPGAFIGLIFCAFRVLLWRSGEDYVV